MPGLFSATKPKKFTVLIYLFLSKRSLLYQSSRHCRRIGLKEFSTLCLVRMVNYKSDFTRRRDFFEAALTVGLFCLLLEW